MDGERHFTDEQVVMPQMDLMQLLINLATGSYSSRISVMDCEWSSQAHMFECMVVLEWNYLKGIRRYGLAGVDVALLEEVCP